MTEHYIFITVFVFVICCGFYPYYRANLSPVQGLKRKTFVERRWAIQDRIWDATIGMCEHKKGSQFYKMHNDNKIKANAELMKLEMEEK